MSDTLDDGKDIKNQLLPQNPDIIERQKRFEKLGISVDSEILVRIVADVSAKTAFEQDLIAVENNPTEKDRFERMYVKGYWQVVETLFGELSFAQIQKHPERAKILDGMKRGEKANFHEWEERVAINEWKKIDEGTQVAIKTNQEALEMNGNLKVALEELQKINWVPKPTLEELKKNAQNIPELKWVPIEEIQSSDKYNNILLADYYVRNANEISKKIDPKDAEFFRNSVNSLSDTLKRPRIEDFSRITASLVLGEGRSQIESRGRELIEKWYSRDVLWNAGDRTITFSNDKWETRTIETARVPPRESMVVAGLSIGRDIPRIDTEVMEKRRLMSEQGEKREVVMTDYNTLSLIDTRNLPMEMRGIWEIHEKYKAEFDRATTANDRLTALENLKISNMNIESSRRAMMTPENMDLMWSYESSIAIEKLQIEKLMSSLRIYTEWEQKLIKYKDIRISWDDTFDSTARSNLTWLTDDSSLFQNMGPRADAALYRMLDETNKNRDPENQINIAEKPLDDIERTTLRDTYNTLIKNLGYTRSILTQAGISGFQDQINTALTKPRWSPWSIEDLMKTKSEPS